MRLHMGGCNGKVIDIVWNNSIFDGLKGLLGGLSLQALLLCDRGFGANCRSH
ncbi:MAG: hypothetical protein J0I16_01220 [Rhizobiales bacterium]|nr:hypothetical protein [Hyphomicrobiales bacterium]